MTSHDGAMIFHDGGTSSGGDGSALPEASTGSDGGAPPPGTAAFLSRSYQGRAYMLYVPAAYAAATAAPLVMMLHGCTQTMADFAAGTQMNKQADTAGFLVAYPDEPTSANVARGTACLCFRCVVRPPRTRSRPRSIA